MYAQRHRYLDHELLKLIILMTLAGALVLLATRPTSAETIRISAPPDNAVQAGSVTKNHDSEPPVLDRTYDAPTARRMWQIIELHNAKQFEQAIERWEHLSLVRREKAWRAIGIGTAYLQTGQLDDAKCVLSDAFDSEHDNAVSHHLLGVICLAKARAAGRVGLACFAEELRSLARIEFEKAIATATQVNPDEPLAMQLTKFVVVRRYDTIYPERMLPPRTPTVADLLAVLDLDDFPTKARIGLAHININEGFLPSAEGHLDVVADTGANIGELYIVLGEAYEQDDQHLAAFRAFIKAMASQAKRVTAAAKSARMLQHPSPLELPARVEGSDK